MKGRCNVYLVKVQVGIIEPWQENQISLMHEKACSRRKKWQLDLQYKGRIAKRKLGPGQRFVSRNSFVA